MKKKFWYKTIKQEDGKICRYKCWKDEFKDESGSECVFITRHKLIKVNGHKIRFYSDSEIKRMTKKQKEEIFNL